jgi:hypothetical protein
MILDPRDCIGEATLEPHTALTINVRTPNAKTLRLVGLHGVKYCLAENPAIILPRYNQLTTDLLQTKKTYLEQIIACHRVMHHAQQN